ncbi:hypothetical protein AB3464_23035 [Pseudomonas asplenii]|uniref:Uncharacterized protein n=1 Tax=Pseudomonas asplenii TaxID=53407 RepID=A0A1H6NP72_9PSED|nr:hypothetical protein [Pseudomonas fuscovaginae]SEI12641.1 hypothetical protein SAMN05216581_2501 [Pseudomonas fuscovaginae]
MSTEQQIASLVSAANNLTNIVNGKIGDIDNALVAARQSYEHQLDDLKNRLPRLLATKNFIMAPNAAGTMIDGWGVHQDITVTKLRSITTTSQATGRPAQDVEFLLKVQADVREQFPDFDIRASDYWRTPAHVWQMKWSVASVSPYLAFPYASDSAVSAGAAAVPQNSYLTMGAFVRILEGGVEGAWAAGAEVGKWRWCSSIIVPTKIFGTYFHLHPMRTSSTGVLEVMLAGACTGVVTHPGDWETMLAMSS